LKDPVRLQSIFKVVKRRDPYGTFQDRQKRNCSGRSDSHFHISLGRGKKRDNCAMNLAAKIHIGRRKREVATRRKQGQGTYGRERASRKNQTPTRDTVNWKIEKGGAAGLMPVTVKKNILSAGVPQG